jgi:hypothetical protein
VNPLLLAAALTAGAAASQTLEGALQEAPVPPRLTREKAALMSCWDRGPAAPLADALELPRTVCVNSVELELRWNRDGDLIAAGASMVTYPEDALVTSYGSGFGQTAGPLSAWRAERVPLQARRADSGYRVEMTVKVGPLDDGGRDAAAILVLYLDRQGKVLNHAVRGELACSESLLCGPGLGKLEEVPYARAP